MSTEVYGASDDLIEVEGDIVGEHCDTNLSNKPCFVILSDGTILSIRYGKEIGAIWEITVIRKGWLLIKVDTCIDEDAPRYSDTAHFDSGIEWAYAANAIAEIK